MAIIRWEPFREMDMLRRQMNRLFYDIAEASRESTDFPAESESGWVPAVEIHDANENLILKAEIPGIEAKDLDIQVTRNAVSLAGERRYEKRTEEGGRFHSEFRYGAFRRVIPLPTQVQNNQVQADFKDGILTLALPKVEEERHRVFKVNLTGSESTTNLTGSESTTPAIEADKADHGVENRQT
jgi:HSP20 family protein